MTGRSRRPTTARQVARRVLQRVGKAAWASLTLDAELGRAGLEPRDRALATELVYGVLRRRSRLDRALGAFAPRGLGGLDPVTLDALRVGAYELLFLRVPPHAAVDEAVEAVKGARGARLAAFANALLRQLAGRGEPPPPEDPVEALLALESCPRWIYAELAALLGPAEAADLVRALSQPAPLGLRVARRAAPAEVVTRLRAERPDAAICPSPLVPRGLLVRGGGALHETAAYREGLVTVQDPGAQLAAALVEAQPGERILDACAGVGGKALQMADETGSAARIDAVDLSAQKLALLQENRLRLGVSGITTRKLDLRQPLPPGLGPYDRILLDAPCTGLGTLRRHPEAKWRRSADEVPRLAALQADLLENVTERLRPGGVLVYSVCTLTRREGPERIEAFLGRHSDLEREGEPRLVLPHRDLADGFYLCRLRKRAAS